MTGGIVSLDGISGSWLADQLDDHGVVHLRDVISTEWLEAVRVSVTDHVARRGEGDFVIVQPDREPGSPAHRLAADPALRQLFSDAAGLRRPKGDAVQKIRTGIPVRAGTERRARWNLFHYDASVLTLIVPIFIPRAALGSCGELAAFGNKRPFHRFVASHLVDMLLTYTSVYRRRVAKMVLADPEKYIVALEPGDVCVFWGYRTYHGNLECAPGLLRASLVLHFGEVHADSWAMRMVWTVGRSRRALRRFGYRPALPSDSAVDTAA